MEKACARHSSYVNGGAISGQRGGVKLGQLRCWLGKQKAPFAKVAFCFSAFSPLDRQEEISPVSGSMVSAEASSPAGAGVFRRRLLDCLSR
jgi:hypothetical protein